MLETKTVSEIINHIKSKDLSIKEVIEYYLNNIEKLNPKINSIVSIKSKNKIIEEAEKKVIQNFAGFLLQLKIYLMSLDFIRLMDIQVPKITVQVKILYL